MRLEEAAGVILIVFLFKRGLIDFFETSIYLRITVLSHRVAITFHRNEHGRCQIPRHRNTRLLGLGIFLPT